MRMFADENGTSWKASVAGDPGGDYKGRYCLALEAAGAQGSRIELSDVRWNSRRTGERTLATMSDVELRRRLRAALGRAADQSGRSWAMDHA